MPPQVPAAAATASPSVCACIRPPSKVRTAKAAGTPIRLAPQESLLFSSTRSTPMATPRPPLPPAPPSAAATSAGVSADLGALAPVVHKKKPIIRKLRGEQEQDLSKPPPRPNHLAYFRNLYGNNSMFQPPLPLPPPSHYRHNNLYNSFMSQGPPPLPIINQLPQHLLCRPDEKSTRVKNNVAAIIWGNALYAWNNLFEEARHLMNFTACPQFNSFDSANNKYSCTHTSLVHGNTKAFLHICQDCFFMQATLRFHPMQHARCPLIGSVI
jgi:hypothetical protein